MSHIPPHILGIWIVAATALGVTAIWLIRQAFHDWQYRRVMREMTDLRRIVEDIEDQMKKGGDK